MKAKTKTFDNFTDGLTDVAQNAGIVLMAAATTLGLIDVSEHQIARANLSVAPVFAVAGQGNQDLNPQRREREEAGPHYTSYSVAQRTPSRTGKQ